MSLYNLDYLKKISNNDTQFIREILNTFVASAHEVIDAISNTHNKDEYVQLSRVIHKFIPSLNFVGVKNLEDDLNKLEIYLANHEQLEALPDLLKEAKHNINLVIEEIKEKELE